MIITETNSRTQAKIVLEIIKRKLNEENDAEFIVDTYNNGRERGYVLKLYSVDREWCCHTNFWVAFSEYRNSDSVVVYTDNDYWVDEITEKSYNEANFFGYGNWIECADYIVKLMENAMETVRQHRIEKVAKA